MNAPSLTSVILMDVLSVSTFLGKCIISAKFCNLYQIFAGVLDLGSILALHKKEFMPVPRTTTAIESAVITFFLLVASACIPLILYCTSQHNRRHRSTRRGFLKSLLLRQQEELPKPQSGFVDSLRVVPTTTLQGRGVDCRLDFSMSEQGHALKLTISHQHLY